MGAIYLQDSGYIKPTNEGSQASSGNMANAGTVVILKTAEFTPNVSRNLSASPEIGTSTPSEVNLGSLKNMQFSLTCKLDTSNATDMGYVQDLLDMVATNGYKLLWYQYTNSTTEKNNGALIYQIALNSKFGHAFTDGEKSAFSISDNFYHLHVLFKSIQPRQSADSSIITYTLSGVVLKADASTGLL